MTTNLTLTTRTFPPRLADLGFTIAVPQGFIEPDFPQENVDFTDATNFAPLALLSSQVALAIITVAARPAYQDGTVLQWLRFLAAHNQLDLQHVLVRTVGAGDGHPAVTAFGVQHQQGTRLNFMIAAFEDGGRFVTAHAMCPAELWPSYGASLSEAVESITLTSPKGSTIPLDDADTRAAAHQQAVAAAHAVEINPQPPAPTRERTHATPVQSAIDAAMAHLHSDRFDQAEQEIIRVDNSIQGNVLLSRLYRAHLESIVALSTDIRNDQRAVTTFRRALAWAQNCYPEPHTQIEADNYEEGRAEDRARLTAILGYDPDA